MIDYYIFDVDQTLAANQKQGFDSDEEYYASRSDDPLTPLAASLLGSICRSTSKVIILTGREANMSKLTLKWVKAKGINIEYISCRPDSMRYGVTSQEEINHNKAERFLSMVENTLLATAMDIEFEDIAIHVFDDCPDTLNLYMAQLEDLKLHHDRRLSVYAYQVDHETLTLVRTCHNGP